MAKTKEVKKFEFTKVGSILDNIEPTLVNSNFFT